MKFLKNLFNKHTTAANNAIEVNELINYATLALSGTGQYASGSMGDDWEKWAQKMQDDLLLFEKKGSEYLNAQLFIIAGKGWENFSLWYRRKNEDKTTPLKNAISMFNEALKIDPKNTEAKIALASVLIERVQVRDLEKGISLLNKIPQKSPEVKNLISKAQRWLGENKLNADFNYNDLELIPLTALREERKNCRALIRSLKKDDDKTEELKQVLNHMYKIAVLHDAATHVMLNCGYFENSKKYNACFKKLKGIAKNINDYSYEEYGKLVESRNCFFSDNDYKAFEKVFGESEKIFNPVKLIDPSSK